MHERTGSEWVGGIKVKSLYLGSNTVASCITLGTLWNRFSFCISSSNAFLTMFTTALFRCSSYSGDRRDETFPTRMSLIEGVLEVPRRFFFADDATAAVRIAFLVHSYMQRERENMNS